MTMVKMDDLKPVYYEKLLFLVTMLAISLITIAQQMARPESPIFSCLACGAFPPG